MAYYFADNNNNDVKKVYYGGFEDKLEAKLFKAYHSNTNEDWALVEEYSEKDIEIIQEDPGRAKWYFRSANKAHYPLPYKEVKQRVKSRVAEIKEKEAVWD